MIGIFEKKKLVDDDEHESKISIFITFVKFSICFGEFENKERERERK